MNRSVFYHLGTLRRPLGLFTIPGPFGDRSTCRATRREGKQLDKAAIAATTTTTTMALLFKAYKVSFSYLHVPYHTLQSHIQSLTRRFQSTPTYPICFSHLALLGSSLHALFALFTFIIPYGAVRILDTHHALLAPFALIIGNRVIGKHFTHYALLVPHALIILHIAILVLDAHYALFTHVALKVNNVAFGKVLTDEAIFTLVALIVSNAAIGILCTHPAFLPFSPSK